MTIGPGGRVLDATAISDITIGRTAAAAAFLAAANDLGIALARQMHQRLSRAGPCHKRCRPRT